MCFGVAGRKHARPRVLLNFVVFNLSEGVDEDDTVLVQLNLIVFDEQVRLSFDDEDAFATLRVEDVVVHDTGVSCLLATQSNVRLDILLDFVRNNLR